MAPAAYKIDQRIPCRLNYDAICHHISQCSSNSRPHLPSDRATDTPIIIITTTKTTTLCIPLTAVTTKLLLHSHSSPPNYVQQLDIAFTLYCCTFFSISHCTLLFCSRLLKKYCSAWRIGSLSANALFFSVAMLRAFSFGDRFGRLVFDLTQNNILLFKEGS